MATICQRTEGLKDSEIPIWYLCGGKFIRAQSSKALSKAAWLKILNLFCLMLFSSTFLSVMWLHFGILNPWCPCPTGSLISRGVQYHTVPLHVSQSLCKWWYNDIKWHGNYWYGKGDYLKLLLYHVVNDTANDMAGYVDMANYVLYSYM